MYGISTCTQMFIEMILNRKTMIKIRDKEYMVPVSTHQKLAFDNFDY